MYAKSFQLYLTHCDHTDYSLPGSSVHGIPQARILEWPYPPLGDLPDPGIELCLLTSPVLAGGFFATSTTREACKYHRWHHKTPKRKQRQNVLAHKS